MAAAPMDMTNSMAGAFLTKPLVPPLHLCLAIKYMSYFAIRIQKLVIHFIKEHTNVVYVIGLCLSTIAGPYQSNLPNLYQMAAPSPAPPPSPARMVKTATKDHEK
jgi:hypothetical protein